MHPSVERHRGPGIAGAQRSRRSLISHALHKRTNNGEICASAIIYRAGTCLVSTDPLSVGADIGAAAAWKHAQVDRFSTSCPSDRCSRAGYRLVFGDRGIYRGGPPRVHGFCRRPVRPRRRRRGPEHGCDGRTDARLQVLGAAVGPTRLRSARPRTARLPRRSRRRAGQGLLLPRRLSASGSAPRSPGTTRPRHRDPDPNEAELQGARRGARRRKSRRTTCR